MNKIRLKFTCFNPYNRKRLYQYKYDFSINHKYRFQFNTSIHTIYDL